MQSISNIKSISYLKSHAAQIAEDLEMNGQPFVITQNGEAKAVIQDVASYEKTQETLALLKILAMGQADVDAGRVHTMDEVMDMIRAKKKNK